MKVKDLLEDIKQTIKESSNKANKDMEDLRLELDTLKNKINSQNSRLIAFFSKIDELKQTSLESATLLEEMAYSLLEDNKQEKPALLKNNETKDISLNNNIISEREKYIN